MKKFYVLRPEVHYSEVEIDAESPLEAFKQVWKEGKGNEVSLNYEMTNEPWDSPWFVKDHKGKILREYDEKGQWESEEKQT